MTRQLIFSCQMGIAGDMVAASLLDLLSQMEDYQNDRLYQLINHIKESLLPVGKLIVEKENNGFLLDTTIDRRTISYIEARQMLEKLIEGIGLKTPYSETANKILEILITAERNVHSLTEATDPNKWDPKKINFIDSQNSKKNNSSVNRIAIREKPITVTFKSIGVAKTPYTDTAPYQPVINEQDKDNAEHSIIVFPDYIEGLKDLESFEYIYVVSYLNKVKNDSDELIFTPPWEKEKNKLMGGRGIFATRSPYRPNPLGLSITKLIKVEGNKIIVQSLDLFNGTPILDIKPYLYSVDRFEANNGWVKDTQHLLLHKYNIYHTHSNQLNGHLHEAVDIIIDIILPLYLLQELEVQPDQVGIIPPVNVGNGTVSFSHGENFKVPVPAVKFILDKYRIPYSYSDSIKTELATPTGVALLAGLGVTKKIIIKQDFQKIIDNGQLLHRGKGFGHKTFPLIENILLSFLIDSEKKESS